MSDLLSSGPVQGMQPLGGAAPIDPGSPVGWVNVLGVRVSDLTLDETAARLMHAVRTRTRGYVCVAGAHGLIECQDDPDLRRVFNGASLVTPDGMPLVWALRRHGKGTAGRVYGPDLMKKMVIEGQATGLRHFLYGTTPETLGRLRKGLLGFAPEARIVGMHAPPFRPLTEAEKHETVHLIDAAAPDIVWVGMSTPKQDRWMADMRPRLAAPVLVGVGAAFDFFSGNTPQAPASLQKMGLEWAFRLAAEPRRLWPRYSRIVPRYLALRGLQRLGLKRFPLAAEPGER